jgi:hypothetical protein
VTALVARLHRWLGERMATRAARILATLAILISLGLVTWPLLNTAFSLQAQRAGILKSLEKCSAKDRDPAAMQLMQRGTVTVGDREYGGARVVGRAVDLFDDAGVMPADVKQELSWRLLGDQVPLWMPYVLVRSPALVIALMLVTGIGALAVVWIGLLLPALEVGGAVAAGAAFCWWMGWPIGTQWLISSALSLLLFAFLWNGARALLGFRSGSIAVASNTALEGVRTLALPGFALPIAMIVPFLALSRERGEALLQAIPGFLDWGHTASYTMAALFVIVFGCASTAFEIRDRQVWSVVTKPISHGGWLIGKWIGTLALGLSLVVGGGLLLAAGTSFLASQKPTDERDARDVRDTVLVGRVGFRPEFEMLPPERLREIIDQTIEGDSVLKADIANGTADDAQTRRSIAVAKQREFLDQQRRIAPGESREYVFHGLGGIVAQKRGISLRFKLHGGGDDEHQKFPAMFQYTTGGGAGMWELREWTPGEAYTLDIDPKFVDEQGDLKIRIFSAGWDEEKKAPVASTITIFVQDDSLEVMANESTFTGNLVSAIIVDGCKLAFLAALAVAAGSLLSFPIAVLLTFGVFSMATLTPFLATSIKYYSPDEKSGIIIWAFQVVVLAIARTVEFLLRGFAARSPSDSLAQGRAITWATLFDTVVGIGLGWTGGVLLIGWLGIRRKEIAVYSGQG